MIEDARDLGFSDAAIAELEAEAAGSDPDTGLPIHPDNAVAVRMLLATRTQWRTVVMSTMERAEIRRTGLDYGILEATARMSRLELGDDDFTRLRILEAESLKAWQEQTKR